MTQDTPTILATIREALAQPALYGAAHHATYQEEALARACSPANMAAVLAHVDDQSERIGHWVQRVEKAERERDDARRSAHILSGQAQDHAALILAYQETEARLREALTKARPCVSDALFRRREICHHHERSYGERLVADAETALRAINAALAGSAPAAPCCQNGDFGDGHECAKQDAPRDTTTPWPTARTPHEGRSRGYDPFNPKGEE
jgi:hypothetical protein